MTIVQKLIDLGFIGTTDLGSKNGKTLVRVWTDKGWAYERFQTVDEAIAWAVDKAPGK
jgi:hypothetical protein